MSGMVLALKASHFFSKDPHTPLKVAQSSRESWVVEASEGGAPPSDGVAAAGSPGCLLPFFL